MTVFTFEDETQLVRSMIKDLLAKSDELAPWERAFINSVQAWAGNFTEKQARVIVLAHAKHFPQLYKFPKKRLRKEVTPG